MTERALRDDYRQDGPNERPLATTVKANVLKNPKEVFQTDATQWSAVQMGRGQTESGVIWITTIFMVIFHVAAIAALFFFNWTNLAVAAILYVFAVNAGIGMGYHRLLVHRGYQVPKVVEYFLAICGTLALEGGPIAWVATHRIHHQHSDRVGDPHTPKKVHGGLIWDGSSPGARSTRRLSHLPATRQTLPRIVFTSG